MACYFPRKMIMHGTHFQNSNLIEKSNFRAIGHSIMWYAIEYLKNNGVKFVDFGTILTTESDKINNINKFKLGFGGDLIETTFFEKIQMNKQEVCAIIPVYNEEKTIKNNK